MGERVNFIVNKYKSPEINSSKLNYRNYTHPSFMDHQYGIPGGQPIKRRKIPNQNIVVRLINRETHSVKPSVSPYYAVHNFHQNVVPNYTIVDIKKPPCSLRKFSPDGKYLIAFSFDSTSIEIYEYKGPSSAESLLNSVQGEKTVFCESDYLLIRSKIFEQFFRLKHTINVAINEEQLNRECYLFTNDGNYIIVGSAVYIADTVSPPFFEIYRNNESISPTGRVLENYTLHLIDMKNGRLCDRRTFKIDKILLSHNQGLYLYHDILCVLSVQHQTIHVYQVTEDGGFVNVRTIGRFCHDDDELFLSNIKCPEWTPSAATFHPFQEATFNTLKHRMLTFMFERVQHYCRLNGTMQPLRLFYEDFESLAQLKMWKIQLLDRNHLLIKYACEDVVTFQIPDPLFQQSFFVVYNMVTTKILAIYENTSEKLLSIFEHFSDLFRNTTLQAPGQLSCSPSINTYSRIRQHRIIQIIANAKNGGKTKAIKHVLAQLPITAQSYSISPYLDLSLFNYDEKWVSALEIPKPCDNQPIRFFARDSGLLRFKIYPGIPEKKPPVPDQQVVAFIFHPHDPFAISVHRTNGRYVMNFHVRHL